MVAKRGGDPHRFAVKRNTISLLASNFSSAAFGLVISIVIARGLGDAALGVYSLALAWSLTLAQVADLGMNTLLTRDLAREPHNTAIYLLASLVAKTIIGAILSIALLLAASVLAQSEIAAHAIQLGAGLILLNAWYSSFTAVFRAFGRMNAILILNVSGLAIQFLATWILITRDWHVGAVIVLAVVMQGVQLGGAGLVYMLGNFAKIDSNSPRVDLAMITRITRAGLPFAIAGILASVEMRANVFLLGALEGERAVGWYSAAARLTEGVRLVPNAFFGAMLPALAALSSAQGQQLFRRAQWSLFAFGLAAALGFTFAAAPLIEFLYGAAFAPAVPTLVLLGWSLIPTMLIGIVTLWLYARGAEATVNVFLLGGLLLQVAAALVLIPMYSATGAAFASLLSDVVLWLGLLLFAARVRIQSNTRPPTEISL